MNRTVVALVLLGVVTGCSTLTSNVPSATNGTTSPTEQLTENVVAPETKQFHLKYATSLTAEPLTKIHALEQSKQLKSETVDQFKILTYQKNDDLNKIYAVINL